MSLYTAVKIRTGKFALGMQVLICVLALVPRSGFADPPSVSLQLLHERPDEYLQRVQKMRQTLSGTTPMKFVVDGVEYTGNYYRSGKTTDVYKIIREGKTTVLRIPRESQMLGAFDQYSGAMREAKTHGLNSTEIISASPGKTLAIEVEYVENLQTYREVLDEVAKNPSSVEARAKITAIKEFSAAHGQKWMPDVNPDNVGLQLKDGKYVTRVVDALESSAKFGDYSPTTRWQSSLGRIFQEVGEEIKARSPTKYSPMKPDGFKVPSREFHALAAIEREVMEVAYSSAKPAPIAPVVTEVGAVCRPESASRADPMKIASARTLGNAAGILNFGGILLTAFLPETNPFAGEPLGVPCAQANRLKGRLKCEWDSQVNPLNHVAYCSKVTSVKPLGKTQFMLRSMQETELCSVVYDSVGFRADESTARETLKKMGIFERDGAVLPGKNAAEILKHIQSKTKLTETISSEQVPFPTREDLSGDLDFYSQFFQKTPANPEIGFREII